MKRLDSNKRIVVGLSGGVDSAVAALLLKQQGHDVLGVFMQNWEAEADDPHCTAEQDLSDAKAVCNTLNIPLEVINFSREYWDNVFQHCLDEFHAARTPNPDIWCNKEIKFKCLLEHALKLNADYLATGHYADIDYKAGQYYLLKGTDTHKDQSYFLYTLGQYELSHTLFPLADKPKPSVRQLAQQAGLITHNKKDSTGICFIGERNFKAFLQQFILAQPGDIQTTDGKTVGKHDGLMFYTLGQRKGLNIGGMSDYSEAAWYVVDKDIPNNTLIIGQGHDHPRLLSTQLTCDDLHWVAGIAPQSPLKCCARTRYHQPDQDCTLRIKDNTATVIFDKPQRAITPGQSVVFYTNRICLGGGIITA